MEALFPRFTLVTQNVDNLHQMAGSASVHELHGNIRRSRCMDCGTYFDEVAVPPSKEAPKCACGGLIRPDVVWFGEMLPERELAIAWSAAEKADLFFSIGTSGEVYPAAQLPRIAREAGAYVVEINPHPTEISRVMNECILGPSGTVLPTIAAELRRFRQTV
jgi:NAD-dependent deacetylase